MKPNTNDATITDTNERVVQKKLQYKISNTKATKQNVKRLWLVKIYLFCNYGAIFICNIGLCQSAPME